MRRGSSSRAKRRAAWGVSTRALPARSPTARSACSPPMSRATATPSSTGAISAQGLDGDPARMSGGACAERAPASPPSRLWRVQMIERAIAADVPFAWVAADTVYGVGEIEMALRRAGKGYVLGVAGNHQFRSWGARPPIAGTAAEIARRARSFVMEAPVGGRRNQRRAAARLGLLRTGRSRRGRI